MIRAMAVAAVVVVAAGCGVADSQVVGDDGQTGDGSAELGAVVRSYVTVRRDIRKCIAPLCGGYFVTDVNRANPREQYVSGLDFTPSQLSQESIDAVLSGEAIVLYGKLGPTEARFNTRPFLVSAAWRGMPGVTAVAGEGFYRVAERRIECFTTPCPQYVATKLNAGGSTRVADVAVGRASLGGVDQVWLASRVLSHDALVTATVGAPGRDGAVLDASQVFIKLPEQIGPCPLLSIAQCPAGKIHSQTRNEDRCIMPSACVTPGPCTFFLINCPDGYTRVQWSGRANACPVVACDPSFTIPAGQ